MLFLFFLLDVLFEVEYSFLYASLPCKPLHLGVTEEPFLSMRKEGRKIM